MPNHPAPRRRRRAFTLLELIVVVVILGVLAALAVPAYARVRDETAWQVLELSARAYGRDAAALHRLTTGAGPISPATIAAADADMPSTIAVDSSMYPTSGQVQFSQAGRSVCLPFTPAGAASDPVRGTCAGLPAPSTLTVTAAGGAAQVDLTWTRIDTATSYAVSCASPATLTAATTATNPPSGDPATTLTGLEPGTTYTCTVTESPGGQAASATATTTGAPVWVIRVSTSSSGGEADNHSSSPVWSPDGTRIAFVTSSNNLTPGDTFWNDDVYVKNLATGATTLVSTDSDGGLGNGESTVPVWSPDGTRIAFQSSASNLVPGDTNGAPDVFVKDLTTGATTRVSTSSAGAQSSGHGWGSQRPAWSPDGTRIAFHSFMDDLVPGDTNDEVDVFVKDLATGATTRVSTSSVGTQGNGYASWPVWSPDGTRIAFTSAASNLVPGDTNGAQDVFVKDLSTGTTTRVSTSSAGTQGSGSTVAPAWSPDGTRIAFTSAASNLVPGDTNGAQDVFVKDLSTGTTTRVSTLSGGAQAGGGSSWPTWSPDGTRIAYERSSSLFIKDLATGDETPDFLLPGPSGGVGSSQFAWSPDGTRFAFASASSTLVPDDTNARWDVFARRLP